MEVERARERRVRVVIKSGGVVVARSCRLYAVKDEELPRKRPRLDGKGSAPTEAAASRPTAADGTGAAKDPMENLRRRRVTPIQHPRQSTDQAPSRPAGKPDVCKMTEEARSPPADKFSVQVPQNLSFGEKLEMTKRKLHQSYQESSNARKQRSIKVLEVDELPKRQDHANEEKKLREKERALMKKRTRMPSFRLRR